MEKNGILATALKLASRSVSRPGFFNFGRRSDVFNQVGKMPIKNDCLTIPQIIDSAELMLSLITCVGIGSREQVLFDEDMILLMLSFDGGVN